MMRAPAFALFPYTTLFRSVLADAIRRHDAAIEKESLPHATVGAEEPAARPVRVDRKSTRLNSSHVRISYAVFCVKTNTRSVGVETEDSDGSVGLDVVNLMD